MQYKNSIEFAVSGEYALFTDPLTRLGGEKCSMPLPSYQALVGICESIFWKPVLKWVVDELRVMKTIAYEVKGIRPIGYGGGNELAYYSYLRSPRYQVRAHFEWNLLRPELECDRNEHKHYFIAKRSLEKGGRRDIFLGTRECQGYVEPCSFGSGPGDYDGGGGLLQGLQFHSFSYPDENGEGKLKARFWRPVLENGVVRFCRPEECEVERTLKNMDKKTFSVGQNYNPLEECEEEL